MKAWIIEGQTGIKNLKLVERESPCLVETTYLCA
jgi:hypothetical protein